MSFLTLRQVVVAVAPLLSLLCSLPAQAQYTENSTESRQSLDLTLDTGLPPASQPNKPVPAKRQATPGIGRLPSLSSRSGVRGLRQLPAPAPRITAQLGCTVVPTTQVRISVESGSRLLSRVPNNTYIAIVAEAGDYWGVLMANNTVGWTPKSNIELTDYKTQVASPGAVPQSDSATGDADSALNEGGTALDPRIAGVLREAFTYLGVPYVWGGNTRTGLDCSAFVRSCFRTQGIDLPRHSGDQIVQGRTITSDLRAGDRLYFDCSSKRSGIDHTGIYVGKGLFIHASGSHGRVVVESLNKPLYLNGIVAIRRDFE